MREHKPEIVYVAAILTLFVAMMLASHVLDRPQFHIIHRQRTERK